MYCEKCGTLKNQNGVCPKCNANVNDNSWVLFTVLKCIFIPFIVAGVIFFISTLIGVFIGIMAAGSEDVAVREGSSFVSGILTFFQIILPIITLLFGWIVILLIDLKKHKKIK